MLQLLTEILKDKSCIASSRTLALCLIRFAGFLRLSELCSIRACDVRLYSSPCSLFLESFKTDQSREGAWINNARSGKVTCHVAALERYLVAAGIKLEEDFPYSVRWHLQKVPRRFASMAFLTQEQEK